MNAIRKFTLASAAAMALGASGSASAAVYHFNFQFDALTSPLGNFAATNIVYSADNLDPALLTYVSGDVNGMSAPVASGGASGLPPGRAYFTPLDFGVPEGTVAGMAFYVSGPFAAGQTYETAEAGRGIRTGVGASYRYTTGRLTITEVAAAVPEPATWATMIAGFLLVGGAMRRPRQALRIAYT